MKMIEDDEVPDLSAVTDADRARARVLWCGARWSLEVGAEDVVAAALAEGRAAGRRELAARLHALIAGRLHLGPTSLGALSAVLDVELDPSLLERVSRG